MDLVQQVRHEKEWRLKAQRRAEELDRIARERDEALQASMLAKFDAMQTRACIKRAHESWRSLTILNQQQKALEEMERRGAERRASIQMGMEQDLQKIKDTQRL